MQTPGLPDLMAVVPNTREGEGLFLPTRLITIEVKAPRGCLSQPQIDFAKAMQMAGIVHIVGGLDDVLTWLMDHGYLKRESVAYYRATVAQPTWVVKA